MSAKQRSLTRQDSSATVEARARALADHLLIVSVDGVHVWQLVNADVLARGGPDDTLRFAAAFKSVERDNAETAKDPTDVQSELSVQRHQLGLLSTRQTRQFEVAGKDDRASFAQMMVEPTVHPQCGNVPVPEAPTAYLMSRGQRDVASMSPTRNLDREMAMHAGSVTEFIAMATTLGVIAKAISDAGFAAAPLLR